MGLNKSRTKTLAKKKADKYFSLYIRMRDADHRGLVKCCTSGKVLHWKEADAGHYISRRFESTRYDPRNCHTQSKQENRFHNGNQLAHQKYIQNRYGHDVAEELYQKSLMTCKRTKADYEFIAEEYYQKIKELESNSIND